MMPLTDLVSRIKGYAKDIWIGVFWKNPYHLWALKVTVSIAFLLIPAELLFPDSFIGTTLALGVVAMALGETDVHPRGRIKSAGLSLILFFIISSLVELLSPFPPYFALLIFMAAFSLTIAGGVNARMQGVTFGTLLIFVYTMLGTDNAREWFTNPCFSRWVRLLMLSSQSCYCLTGHTGFSKNSWHEVFITWQSTLM